MSVVYSRIYGAPGQKRICKRFDTFLQAVFSAKIRQTDETKNANVSQFLVFD